MDCGKCSKNISDNEVIKCISCLTLLHFFWADLSEPDFKIMLPMNKKKCKCSICKIKKIAAPALSMSPKSGLASSLNVDTEILTKYMDSKLADLRQQWRADLNAAISEVTRKLSDDILALESRMSLFEDRLSQAEDRVASIESSPTNLLDEDATLRTQLETLTSKFDDLDQASRSCNVEIQNIPEKKEDLIIKFEVEKFGARINGIGGAGCLKLDIEIFELGMEVQLLPVPPYSDGSRNTRRQAASSRKRHVESDEPATESGKKTGS
ncbi:unnamed protein product [Leptidea sinapis]|uniref:Uncharacterized protein n=1 Tax=Leptidea sinapis TaxID=189913 RepID=A0A5E4QJ89_9NEOP|nr:unnamed protein product [Leptidea sinapis]